MQEERKNRVKTGKNEVIGSETVLEKIKIKTPWIFGNTFRKPKIMSPGLNRPRMGIPLPGKSIAVIGVYIILFLLQTGIVYLVFREVPALGSNPQTGTPMFLYPDINESFIIEGVVASIFIFMCSIGFILLYQASKFVYNKSVAVRYLAVGILLILASFIALQAMITIKLGQKLFNV
ncbi:MAG: hypothetical protein KGD67_03085 [Candidatus Lokiarchaeota archaeon]|nr:hypothetical protein [Candidatus Lokiarchaeota archaeon]